MKTGRLNQIKSVWIGRNNNGLAVVGNSSYRMVGELIAECERLTRAGGCQKVCYGHEQTAITAATAMHGKTGDNYDSYFCKHHQKWHIGHAEWGSLSE